MPENTLPNDYVHTQVTEVTPPKNSGTLLRRDTNAPVFRDELIESLTKRIKKLEQSVAILLHSSSCWSYERGVESAEEISDRFDIELEQAKDIVEVMKVNSLYEQKEKI